MSTTNRRSSDSSIDLGSIPPASYEAFAKGDPNYEYAICIVKDASVVFAPPEGSCIFPALVLTLDVESRIGKTPIAKSFTYTCRYSTFKAHDDGAPDFYGLPDVQPLLSGFRQCENVWQIPKVLYELGQDKKTFSDNYKVVIAGTKTQQASLELKFDSVRLYKRQTFSGPLSGDQICFEPVCPQKTVPHGDPDPYRIARIQGISKLSDERVKALLNANPKQWSAELPPDKKLPDLYRLRLCVHYGAGGAPWSNIPCDVIVPYVRNTPDIKKVIRIPAGWSGMLYPDGAIKANTGKVSLKDLHEQYSTSFGKPGEAHYLHERPFWDQLRFHTTSKSMYQVNEKGQVEGLTLGTIYMFRG